MPPAVDAEAKRLSEVLSRAPNLVSLSTKSSGEYGTCYRIKPNIPLISLTTLEYCGPGTLDLLHSHMPNLTHLIARPETLHRSGPTSTLRVFGQQLKAIEFLDTKLFKNNAFNPVPITRILRHCPNLNTLKYTLDCIKYIAADTIVPSLQNIVLRINPRLQDDEVLEQRLPQHFDVLTGPAFPALRRVVLDGIDTLFHPGYAVMHRRFPVKRVEGTSVVWEC
jgi:hypothetical protein